MSLLSDNITLGYPYYTEVRSVGGVAVVPAVNCDVAAVQ
jgi:hypothetical protein